MSRLLERNHQLLLARLPLLISELQLPNSHFGGLGVIRQLGSEQPSSRTSVLPVVRS